MDNILYPKYPKLVGGLSCYHCAHLDECSAENPGEVVKCQMENPREPNYGDSCEVNHSGKIKIFIAYEYLKESLCWLNLIKIRKMSIYVASFSPQ